MRIIEENYVEARTLLHELYFIPKDTIQQYTMVPPSIVSVEYVRHTDVKPLQQLCGIVDNWALNYCHKEIHLRCCKGCRSTSARAICALVLYIQRSIIQYKN